MHPARRAGLPGQEKQGDLDSNQDKQNQNLLCYRYTIALCDAAKHPESKLDAASKFGPASAGRHPSGFHGPHTTRVREGGSR